MLRNIAHHNNGCYTTRYWIISRSYESLIIHAMPLQLLFNWSNFHSHHSLYVSEAGILHASCSSWRMTNNVTTVNVHVISTNCPTTIKDLAPTVLPVVFTKHKYHYHLCLLSVPCQNVGDPAVWQLPPKTSDQWAMMPKMAVTQTMEGSRC